MKLYIVRHGETFQNRSGIVQGHGPGKLTKKGIEQAKLVGEFLKDANLQEFYVSDLARARETARHIHQHHRQAPLHVTKQLRERSLGRFEGKEAHHYTKFIAGYRSYYPERSYFQYPIFGGETLGEAQRRIVLFVEHLHKKYFGRNIIIVTHGTVSRLLFMHLERMPAEQYHDELLRFENCSLTVLNFDRNFVHTVAIRNRVFA